MIRTYKDYKYYISEDLKRFPNKPNFRDTFYRTERYYSWKLIKNLRKLEYVSNQNLFVFKIYEKYLSLKYNQIQHECNTYIPINVCGPGLYLPHLGNIFISEKAKIGRNCTIRSGTVLLTNLGIDNRKSRKIEVGDNVEFSLGCKILTLKIGNNVVVGPNAVVTKKIPDNSIAFGNPCNIMSRDF